MAPATTQKKSTTSKKKASASEFAVIETGGKQYKVAVGDVIKIEKIKDTLTEGDTVAFDKVLLVDNGTDTTLGDPYIKGAKVEGTLEKQGRAKKISVVRFKNKINRPASNKGHRQPFMEVKIQAIK